VDPEISERIQVVLPPSIDSRQRGGGKHRQYKKRGDRLLSVAVGSGLTWVGLILTITI